MKAKILTQNHKKPIVSLISAIARNNRTIGLVEGGLPWHIPEDFKYFREKTTGHPIIMGKTTFEEFKGKLLPNRKHIVVVRELDYKAQNEFIVTHSIEEAIEKAKKLDGEEIFVIGGSQIYHLAIPYADKLYITQVDTNIESPIKFPDYSQYGFNKVISSYKSKDENFSYEFQEIIKGDLE